MDACVQKLEMNSFTVCFRQSARHFVPLGKDTHVAVVGARDSTSKGFPIESRDPSQGPWPFEIKRDERKQSAIGPKGLTDENVDAAKFDKRLAHSYDNAPQISLPVDEAVAARFEDVDHGIFGEQLFDRV
jgi:hypothetical protein